MQSLSAVESQRVLSAAAKVTVSRRGQVELLGCGAATQATFLQNFELELNCFILGPDQFLPNGARWFQYRPD